MRIAGRGNSVIPVETRLAASWQRRRGKPRLYRRAMLKIDDLGKAFPALQGCFQSREGAITKVGIWRACTASAEAVPGSQFSVLSSKRKTLVPRFCRFTEN